MRAKMTPAERLLWARVEGLRGCRPQKVLCGYIADFAFPSARLVVEVDGPSHIGREAYDRERDAAMWAVGWRVLRFTNDEVRADINRVMGAIREALTRRRLPRQAPKAKAAIPRIGDAVQFGCAVRKWKRQHPPVAPKARLVKNGPTVAGR